MPRFANPIDKRIAWVQKTYGTRPSVPLGVAEAWLSAIGLDTERESMVRHFELRQKVLDARGPATPAQWIERLVREGAAPPTTRFDAYIPWLARELNRAEKQIDKLRRQHADPRRRSPAQMPAMARLYGRKTALINRFRAVVDWAGESGVDLNRVKGEEALAESREWGELTRGKANLAGEVVYRFQDGWTVNELRTAAELAAEGDVMQNCIGDLAIGCYTEPQVKKGHTRIFSLRSPEGKSHLDMAIDPDTGEVQEFKGKQNDLPRKPEYVQRMVEFRCRYLEPKYPPVMLPPGDPIHEVGQYWAGVVGGDYHGALRPLSSRQRPRLVFGSHWKHGDLTWLFREDLEALHDELDEPASDYAAQFWDHDLSEEENLKREGQAIDEFHAQNYLHYWHDSPMRGRHLRESSDHFDGRELWALLQSGALAIEDLERAVAGGNDDEMLAAMYKFRYKLDQVPVVCPSPTRAANPRRLRRRLLRR